MMIDDDPNQQPLNHYSMAGAMLRNAPDLSFTLEQHFSGIFILLASSA
jgi:hypothetical protein